MQRNPSTRLDPAFGVCDIRLWFLHRQGSSWTCKPRPLPLSGTPSSCTGNPRLKPSSSDVTQSILIINPNRNPKQLWPVTTADFHVRAKFARFAGHIFFCGSYSKTRQRLQALHLRTQLLPIGGSSRNSSVPSREWLGSIHKHAGNDSRSHPKHSVWIWLIYLKFLFSNCPIPVIDRCFFRASEMWWKNEKKTWDANSKIASSKMRQLRSVIYADHTPIQWCGWCLSPTVDGPWKLQQSKMSDDSSVPPRPLLSGNVPYKTLHQGPADDTPFISSFSWGNVTGKFMVLACVHLGVTHHSLAMQIDTWRRLQLIWWMKTQSFRPTSATFMLYIQIIRRIPSGILW